MTAEELDKRCVAAMETIANAAATASIAICAGIGAYIGSTVIAPIIIGALR